MADPTSPAGRPATAAAPRRHPRLRTGDGWPSVSVVMPILDEEDYLATAVDRVFAQRYPGEFEVVLALGPSRDDTDRIAAEVAGREPRLTLVHNPTGATPAGLNTAIQAAHHDVIVRVDGHGFLSPGYIARAVELLDEVDADNVGGLMAAEGTGPFQQAVARAMTTPFGIGGERFHVGGEAGAVDSVYLGVFRRTTLLDLGGYDETYRRAQDWELNYRIRANGGLVWFSPDLRVTYRPRGSWTSLRRQFYRTGQWRRVVSRLNPGSATWRYLAPPVATVAIAVGTVLGLLGLLASLPVLLLGFAAPAGYLVALLIGSLISGRGLPAAARAWLPLVIGTMHVSWGLGFICSPRALVHESRAGRTARRAG